MMARVFQSMMLSRELDGRHPWTHLLMAEALASGQRRNVNMTSKLLRDLKAKAEKFEDAQCQVEHFLSDKNLKHDSFYRVKISTRKDGWFQMCHITTAPRIKTLIIMLKDLAIDLIDSKSIETKKDQGGKYWIRRKGGKKLPPYKSRTS
jgi:hypothetical protein